MISKSRLPVAILTAAFISAALLSTSCTSYRVNQYLIKNTSTEDKANLMFARGKTLYIDEVKGKNNFAAIDEAKRFLKDALATNPLHPEAQDYLDEIDSYVTTRLAANKDTATKLFAKENRTDAESYRMIQAITVASSLNKNDKDVQNIQKSTKEIRAAVILSKETQLADLQIKIDAEKAEAQLVKQLREADLIIRDIEKIDPSNSKAAKTRESISKTADGLVQKDIDTANQALTAKKYADAETAILRAEKNLAAVSQEPGTTIPAIKYKVYYDWALSLYNAKNNKTASDKIARAIKASKTQEATALKAKIDKALATRDYDAEIQTILASVDDSLTKKDPATAMKLINDNVPKLKVQANIDSLTAKKADVRSQLKTVYQDGIARYNEEDYEGARQKFQIIIAIEPEYEQAQAYHDRAETKIRALTGKD
jgi:hypothetical protein